MKTSQNASVSVRSSSQLALLVQKQRKARQLSQQEVAEMAGIRQSTLSDFERNPSKARIETAFQILTALGLELRSDALRAAKDEK